MKSKPDPPFRVLTGAPALLPRSLRPALLAPAIVLAMILVPAAGSAAYAAPPASPPHSPPSAPLNRAGGSQRTDPAISALLAAVKAQQQGHVTEAIADYQTALRLKPDFLPAHFQLSQLYLQTGHTAEAMQELGIIARSKAPADSHLRTAAELRLAALYQRAGQTERARAELRSVLAAEPHNADALAEMGSMAMQAGDTTVAVTYFRAYSRLVPGNARVHFNLGVLLNRLRHYPQALHEFQASAALPGALPAPDRSRALLNVGLIYDELGRSADAVKAYRQAVAADPADASAWLARGVDEEKVGKDDEALRDYRQVLHLRPGAVPALFNEGVLLLKNHRYSEAASAFSSVLKVDPGNGPARTNLAFAYVSLPPKERTAHLAQARSLYLKAEAQDPHNAGNYAGLAFLDELDSKYADAAAQYENLAKLKPGRSDILDRLAATYARAASKDKVYWPHAIDAARRAAAIHPDESSGWLLLSDYQSRAGRDQDAVTTLRDFVKRSPRSTDAMLALADLLVRTPATAAEASSVYDAVLKQQPNNVEALMGRAQIERTKDPAAAARDLEIAFARAPGGEWFNAGNQLADAYRKLNQPANVARTYESTIQKANQTKPGEGLDLRSYVPFLRQMLAGAYLQAGNYDAAAKTYDAIYQANHAATASLLSSAKAYESAGEPALALQEYDRAVQVSPVNSTALGGLIKTGLSVKGEPWLNDRIAALLKTPGPLAAVTPTIDAIQRAAFDTRNLTWLTTFYQTLHKADPGALAPAVGLADAESATGKWQEALDLDTSLITAHPQEASLLAARGDIETSHGQVIQAADDYEAAIKLSPDSLGYLQALSAVLTRIPGREQQQRTVLEAILAIDPGSLIDARRLANLYSGPDSAQQRIALYRRLLARAPKAPEYHDALASELEATGDKAGARAEYLEAQRLDPQDNVSRIALQRLTQPSVPPATPPSVPPVAPAPAPPGR